MNMVVALWIFLELTLQCSGVRPAHEDSRVAEVRSAAGDAVKWIGFKRLAEQIFHKGREEVLDKAEEVVDDGHEEIFGKGSETMAGHTGKKDTEVELFVGGMHRGAAHAEAAKRRAAPEPVLEKKGPKLDDFIGREKAHETNVEWPGQASYTSQYDDFHKKHFKHMANDFQDHAAELQTLATGSYATMKNLDGTIEKTAKLMSNVQQSADSASEDADEESKEVAGESLNGFGTHDKFLKDRGSHPVDEAYGQPLSESALLAEGVRQKESGKFDFWANEMPAQYEKVELGEAHSSENNRIFGGSGAEQKSSETSSEADEGGDSDEESARTRGAQNPRKKAVEASEDWDDESTVTPAADNHLENAASGAGDSEEESTAGPDHERTTIAGANTHTQNATDEAGDPGDESTKESIAKTATVEAGHPGDDSTITPGEYDRSEKATNKAEALDEESTITPGAYA